MLQTFFRLDYESVLPPARLDKSAAGPVHQPMQGGLPSDGEEVLLPWEIIARTRINCEYNESTVLPVNHQALLVQHQASPQAKNS